MQVVHETECRKNDGNITIVLEEGPVHVSLLHIETGTFVDPEIVETPMYRLPPGECSDLQIKVVRILGFRNLSPGNYLLSSVSLDNCEDCTYNQIVKIESHPCDCDDLSLKLIVENPSLVDPDPKTTGKVALVADKTKKVPFGCDDNYRLEILGQGLSTVLQSSDWQLVSDSIDPGSYIAKVICAECEKSIPFIVSGYLCTGDWESVKDSGCQALHALGLKQSGTSIEITASPVNNVNPIIDVDTCCDEDDKDKDEDDDSQKLPDPDIDVNQVSKNCNKMLSLDPEYDVLDTVFYVYTKNDGSGLVLYYRFPPVPPGADASEIVGYELRVNGLTGTHPDITETYFGIDIDTNEGEIPLNPGSPLFTFLTTNNPFDGSALIDVIYITNINAGDPPDYTSSSCFLRFYVFFEGIRGCDDTSFNMDMSLIVNSSTAPGSVTFTMPPIEVIFANSNLNPLTTDFYYEVKLFKVAFDDAVQEVIDVEVNLGETVTVDNLSEGRYILMIIYSLGTYWGANFSPEFEFFAPGGVIRVANHMCGGVFSIENGGGGDGGGGDGGGNPGGGGDPGGGDGGGNPGGGDGGIGDDGGGNPGGGGGGNFQLMPCNRSVYPTATIQEMDKFFGFATELPYPTNPDRERIKFILHRPVIQPNFLLAAISIRIVNPSNNVLATFTINSSDPILPTELVQFFQNQSTQPAVATMEYGADLYYTSFFENIYFQFTDQTNQENFGKTVQIEFLFVNPNLSNAPLCSFTNRFFRDQSYCKATTSVQNFLFYVRTDDQLVPGSYQFTVRENWNSDYSVGAIFNIPLTSTNQNYYNVFSHLTTYNSETGSYYNQLSLTGYPTPQTNFQNLTYANYTFFANGIDQDPNGDIILHPDHGKVCIRKISPFPESDTIRRNICALKYGGYGGNELRWFCSGTYPFLYLGFAYNSAMPFAYDFDIVKITYGDNPTTFQLSSTENSYRTMIFNNFKRYKGIILNLYDVPGMSSDYGDHIDVVLPSELKKTKIEIEYFYTNLQTGIRYRCTTTFCIFVFPNWMGFPNMPTSQENDAFVSGLPSNVNNFLNSIQNAFQNFTVTNISENNYLNSVSIPLPQSLPEGDPFSRYCLFVKKLPTGSDAASGVPKDSYFQNNLGELFHKDFEVVLPVGASSNNVVFRHFPRGKYLVKIVNLNSSLDNVQACDQSVMQTGFFYSFIADLGETGPDANPSINQGGNMFPSHPNSIDPYKKPN